ncbi:hypothetical protein BGZ65_007880 [Modicella reniformis]|uniref:Cytochrome b5 heme-binding domain-containing protein n=1 Tax=Modicella reniformis TaxID=1440133 RepID=A0A9P6M865_9FUNG|nr:hypothetical protein BGZ65_007880 [Modicella reniformis]
MSEIKNFTMADLAQHSTRDDLYLAIGGKVYDCTTFIDEHPGGEEVLLDEAGKDATESFDDVGHSNQARDQLREMYVGEFKNDNAGKKDKPGVKTTSKTITTAQSLESGRFVSWVKAFF